LLSFDASSGIILLFDYCMYVYKKEMLWCKPLNKIIIIISVELYFLFFFRTWEQRTWNENRFTWSARLSELVSLCFLLIKIDVIHFNLMYYMYGEVWLMFYVLTIFCPKFWVNGRTFISKNLIDIPISYGYKLTIEGFR